MSRTEKQYDFQVASPLFYFIIILKIIYIVLKKVLEPKPFTIFTKALTMHGLIIKRSIHTYEYNIC